MEKDLKSLCCVLVPCLKLTQFKNEFETMRPLFDKCPEELRTFIDSLPIHYFEKLERSTEFDLRDEEKRIRLSNIKRKEGNDLFNAVGEHRNVLAACRHYNDAIFAALDCKGMVDELALAFANRAMALQTFGYYQQAYDDCVFAILYGYPSGMRHKIVTRQAYCALKLKELKTVQKHIEELKVMQLNNNFQKQLRQLQIELQQLKSLKNGNENQTTLNDDIPLNRESQEIVDSFTEKGVYMRAKCDIPKNGLIFTERASAAVPVFNKRSLCHQCCLGNFVPYPCRHCLGRVVYCSLKCQQEHRAIHNIECSGYRILFFPNVGIGHIALRQILDNGLLSLSDYIKPYTSSKNLWNSLSPGGDIASNKQIAYADSLRMISHMDKMQNMEIAMYASNAFLLVAYLKRYTRFFTKLMVKFSEDVDWELIVAALILRHIGQMITSAHILTGIDTKPLQFTTTDFPLLNDKIWSSPMHLKAGYLNIYGHYSDTVALNLPYLSVCNHSCVQLFAQRLSGRYVSTYALHDIKANEEITNCYFIDCRKVKSSSRRKILRTNYHFDCKCENCVLPEQDNNFNQYHQYRCEYAKCRTIFTPIIPHLESLDWWLQFGTTVYCTNCGCEQKFKWFSELQHLKEQKINAQFRRRSYQIFKSLENVLLGLNDARSYVARQLLYSWFNLPYLGIPLQDVDYIEIADMTKYVMECSKTMVCINSVEYIADMVHLWDVIALGKYKYTKHEMDEMLFALSILADDLKLIFLNYYNDYVKDKSSQK